MQRIVAATGIVNWGTRTRGTKGCTTTTVDIPCPGLFRGGGCEAKGPRHMPTCPLSGSCTAVLKARGSPAFAKGSGLDESDTSIGTSFRHILCFSSLFPCFLMCCGIHHPGWVELRNVRPGRRVFIYHARAPSCANRARSQRARPSATNS